MSVQTKICGINSVEVADAAIVAGADYGGLVFHDRSPRKLTLEAAVSLSNRMRGRIRVVTLLCDAGDEQIAAVVRAVRPDFLQLHGSETADRVGAVRSRFEVPVMKALPIAEASDLSGIADYEDAADMLLFDAKPSAGAERSGGHGIAFDWQLLRGRKFARPWLLAGGLTAENVQRAIRTAGALGVDASSGVETAPGVKSPDMVRAFIAAARSTQFATEQQA